MITTSGCCAAPNSGGDSSAVPGAHAATTCCAVQHVAPLLPQRVEHQLVWLAGAPATAALRPHITLLPMKR
jgi:hypothetical protein